MFLTVVTRCYKRPQALQANVASLNNQTCDDWEQLFIVDEVGRGIGWANRQFARYANQVSGDYVLMLDDDDRLIRDDAIEILKRTAYNQPEIVIFRGLHGRHGILPSDETWGDKPKSTHISGQDFITRSDVWKAHIEHFGHEKMGDYAFLSALWPSVQSVVWLDELLVEQQAIGGGEPECIAQ